MKYCLRENWEKQKQATEKMQIELLNLHKTLGKNIALRGITDIYESGKVHGIIGPNGAGKTTLMRIMAGLLSPTEGGIAYRSKDGRQISAGEAKLRTGYFPQEPSLYPDLSCQEHLRFFAELYDMKEEQFKEKSEQLLKATGMMPFRSRPAGKLSGGMYKKLGLMCVLLNSPALLLLDEPTIGVDPVSRRELWDIVYKSAGDNMTVILSTSYMDEAERCGKIHVLNEGRLIASGTPQEAKRQFGTDKFEEIFLKKISNY